MSLFQKGYMRWMTLATKVRQYLLQSKRYLVLFDDAWEEKFCDEVEHALPNNDKGGRIIITTRMMHFAEYFKRSFLFMFTNYNICLQTKHGNSSARRHLDLNLMSLRICHVHAFDSTWSCKYFVEKCSW